MIPNMRISHLVRGLIEATGFFFIVLTIMRNLNKLWFRKLFQFKTIENTQVIYAPGDNTLYTYFAFSVNNKVKVPEYEDISC